MVISKKKTDDSIAQIIDVNTRGLGNVGQGPDGVFLTPGKDGLVMPFGKDVFVHACNYMDEALDSIMIRNNIKLEEMSYLIPHQANERIIRNLGKRLNMKSGSVLSNISQLGNTGCASTGICLSQNIDMIKKEKALVGFTVFGGGYSSGAMLMKFI